MWRTPETPLTCLICPGGIYRRFSRSMQLGGLGSVLDWRSLQGIRQSKLCSWLDKSVHVCMLIAKSSFRYRKKYETLSIPLSIHVNLLSTNKFDQYLETRLNRSFLLFFFVCLFCESRLSVVQSMTQWKTWEWTDNFLERDKYKMSKHKHKMSKRKLCLCLSNLQMLKQPMLNLLVLTFYDL